MKKYAILLLIGFLLSTFDSSAGTNKKRRRKHRKGSPTIEVGINPLEYLSGRYNAIGALHFSENSSFFVEIAYLNRNAGTTLGRDSLGVLTVNDVIFKGFSIAPEYRYYFSPDNDNDRWFIGGYLKFRNFSTTGAPYASVDVDGEFIQYDIKSNGLAPGLTFGYEWALKSGLTLTVWTGGGYYAIYKEGKTPDFMPSTDPSTQFLNSTINAINRLDFRGGFTLGWRF